MRRESTSRRESDGIAIKSLDKARLRVAFSGLDRAEVKQSMRRLWPPCWRGLVSRPRPGRCSRKTWVAACSMNWPCDEDPETRTLCPFARLRELTAELEKLDKAHGSPAQGSRENRAGEAIRRVETAARPASIALGEFQTKLVKDHGPLAGEVARLDEIQSRLPADTALVAWVDMTLSDPAQPILTESTGAWSFDLTAFPLDPDRRHRVRRAWTKADTELVGRVRTELRRTGPPAPAKLHSLIDNLRAQRLGPLPRP